LPINSIINIVIISTNAYISSPIQLTWWKNLKINNYGWCYIEWYYRENNYRNVF
jgi:hypothetical protein